MNIKEIIVFAIQKEQEAIDFYEDIVKKVKSKAIASEILKIRNMEEQHKEQLKKLDINNALKSSKKTVSDLKIADYTVETEPSNNMSWQDLLNIAMHRELAAAELYQRLSEQMEDDSMIKIFNYLAKEESAHKLFFEKMWDEDIMKEN